MKRLASILTVVMMLLTMVPYTAFANDAAASSANSVEPYVNPYVEGDTASLEAKPLDNISVGKVQKLRLLSDVQLDSSDYCTTVAEAAALLREQMKNRNNTPSVNLIVSEYSEDYVIEKADEIFFAAMEHTGVPTEGDSLKFSWEEYVAEISGYSYGSKYYMTFDYNIKYYTTAEQEAQFDAAVEELMVELALDGKTKPQIIKAIYDYITKNVTYDYINLDNDAHKLKYTAYAALINKTAVCQGYAALFYRLALECGIDARVVSGVSFDEAHGWNIVQIDDKYYYADSTWDAGLTQYDYFLLGSADFKDHDNDAEYLTDEFKAKYPISDTSYVYYCEKHVWESEYTIDEASTCVENGSKSIHCAVCDAINEETITEAELVKHSFTKWATVAAATYSKQGQEMRECTVCDHEEYRDTDKAVSTTFKFRYDDYTVGIGMNILPALIVKPLAPEDGDVVWTSSDKTIAAVDSDGKVTGISEGKAVITAKLVDGSEATCTVTVKQGVWKKSGTKWWFQYPDGTYPKNCWETIKGKEYYFDKSGYMVTNKWVGDYYVDANGYKVKNKWVGAYYVGPDGKYVKNQWVGNYYCGSNGKYQKGWLKLDEGWYYLGTNGKVNKGWFQVKKVWYYGDKTTGLLYEKEWLDNKYYFKSGGAMATGWYQIDGDYYYFTSSGAKVTNKWVGNYYLKADGIMATDEWIGNYYVGANGKWVKGAKK